jgi:hypothetical protein
VTKVPDDLRRTVVEGSASNHEGVRNELLLCLIDAIEHQNAILDDTIHHELHEMKQSLGSISLALMNRPFQ